MTDYTLFLPNYCTRFALIDNGITVTDDKGANFPLHSLVGMLRKKYEHDGIFQSSFTLTAIQNSISLFDKYNFVRNNQSYAHDNEVLGTMEAEFAVRIMADLLTFIDKAESYRKRYRKKRITRRFLTMYSRSKEKHYDCYGKQLPELLLQV